MRTSHTAPVLPLSEGDDEHAHAHARSAISAHLLLLARNYISASLWIRKEREEKKTFLASAQSKTWRRWQRSNRFSCRRRRRREGGEAVVYNLSRGEGWAERLLSLLQVKIYFVFSGCENRRWHWQKNALHSGREFIIEWHWLRLICWDESDCKMRHMHFFFFFYPSLSAPIPRRAMKY